MDVKLRKATEADIKEIKMLLSFYYLDTEKVEKNVPEFIVAVPIIRQWDAPALISGMSLSCDPLQCFRLTATKA